MATSVSVRKKTGETCLITGSYSFDGYTDGTQSPPPTSEEKVIPMEAWETFPPVKSCNKGAWWRLN